MIITLVTLLVTLTMYLNTKSNKLVTCVVSYTSGFVSNKFNFSYINSCFIDKTGLIFLFEFFFFKKILQFHDFMRKIQLPPFFHSVFLLVVGADSLIWQVYDFFRTGAGSLLRHGIISLRRNSLQYIYSSLMQTFLSIRRVSLSVVSWYLNSLKQVVFMINRITQINFGLCNIKMSSWKCTK